MSVPLLLAASRSTSTIIVLIGVMIALAVIFGAAVLVLRKRAFDAQAGASADTLMEQLRAMRDAGTLSQEEYEQTRRTLARRIADKGPEATDTSGQPAARRPATPLRPEKPGQTLPRSADPPAPKGPSRPIPPGYDDDGPAPGSSRPGGGRSK